MLLENSERKTKRLSDKKLSKFDENKEENQKMGLNFLAPGDMLKKSCKDDKYFGRKNLLTQWECWGKKLIKVSKGVIMWQKKSFYSWKDKTKNEIKIWTFNSS